jgi:hypothetical protein
LGRVLAVRWRTAFCSPSPLGSGAAMAGQVNGSPGTEVLLNIKKQQNMFICDVTGLEFCY